MRVQGVVRKRNKTRRESRRAREQWTHRPPTRGTKRKGSRPGRAASLPPSLAQGWRAIASQARRAMAGPRSIHHARRRGGPRGSAAPFPAGPHPRSLPRPGPVRPHHAHRSRRRRLCCRRCCRRCPRRRCLCRRLARARPPAPPLCEPLPRQPQPETRLRAPPRPAPPPPRPTARPSLARESHPAVTRQPGSLLLLARRSCNPGASTAPRGSW